MISAWTRHLKTDEEKEKFEKGLRNSKWILDRLSEILTDAEDELSSSEISAKNYDSPSWAYKQAHTNGQRSTLRTLKRLINLGPKNDG